MGHLHKSVESYSSAGFGLVTNTADEQATSHIEVGAQIILAILDGYEGSTAVQLWDGRLVAGRPDAASCIVFINRVYFVSWFYTAVYRV